MLPECVRSLRRTCDGLIGWYLLILRELLSELLCTVTRVCVCARGGGGLLPGLLRNTSWCISAWPFQAQNIASPVLTRFQVVWVPVKSWTVSLFYYRESTESFVYSLLSFRQLQLLSDSFFPFFCRIFIPHVLSVLCISFKSSINRFWWKK